MLKVSGNIHIDSHTCFLYHFIGVYCLECDINRIVSGGGDNMVVLWDTKTGQSSRSFAGHTQEIVSYTSTSTQLLSLFPI